MTQYPNSFLQSQSQPWGRSVEQRLADLERQDRLVAQESNNNFAQINSTFGRLAQFYSVGSSTSVSNTVGQPGVPGWELQAFNAAVDTSVTIVANTGRVIVSVSAAGELSVPGTGFARGYIYSECVGVDSLVLGSPGLTVGNGTFSSGQYVGFGTTFQLLYTLPVGEYTFRSRRAIEVGGSSTNASFVTTYRAITAQSIP